MSILEESNTTNVENVLSLNGLTKQYGALTAVNQLDLAVPKGSVYGLLGPNGSGKTTTLGMILGVIQSNAGSYQWFGKNPEADALKRIGAILETPNFYPYMSAYKNLEIVAKIKGVDNKRINEVLELVGLKARCNDNFKTYSLGMKQRLAIASALLPNPEVLILDEPTNGLDPQGIAEIRDLIRTVASKGVTIVLASHLLDEVEKVCTDVLVLQFGKKLYEGPVSGINTDFDQILVGSVQDEALKTALDGIPQIKQIDDLNGKYMLSLSEDLAPEALNKILFEKGITVNHLERKPKTLETHFLELTNTAS